MWSSAVWTSRMTVAVISLCAVNLNKNVQYNVRHRRWGALNGDSWTAGVPDGGQRHRENLQDDWKHSCQTHPSLHLLVTASTTFAADLWSIHLDLDENTKRSWVVVGERRQISARQQRMVLLLTGLQQLAWDHPWLLKRLQSAEKRTPLRVEWMTTARTAACWQPSRVTVLVWPVQIWCH